MAQSEPTLAGASCKMTNVLCWSLTTNPLLFMNITECTLPLLFWAILPTFHSAYFVTICFWLNSDFAFKPSLVQNFSRIKVCNTLALPILLSGSEIWTLTKKDNKWSTSINTAFFRRTDVYTLFRPLRNEEMLEEFKVEPFDKILKRYKSNLLRYVTRKTSSRMSKIMLNYRPNGWGRLGRSLK